MKGSRTLLVAGAAVALTAVALLATPIGAGALDALRILATADPGAVRVWVLSFGPWAPVMSAALMILQALAAPLPSSPITYANGLIFGAWWGALLSWASALLAAVLCFQISRHLGRPVAERLVGASALAWSDRFFARFGGRAVLVGRLVPVISFDVVSYGAGLTPLSFGRFLLASAAGMIPATLLYSYLGELGGTSGSALLTTLAAVTLLGFLGAASTMIRNRVRATANRALSRAFTRLPWLGRLWGRRARLVTAETVPWTPPTKPLRTSRATLVTTGGVHCRGDVPFDMTNPAGDPSFRVIPRDADTSALDITHDYYDHRDADRDVNVVFPLARFRELAARGLLGGLTDEHYSFMGHIDGPLVAVLREATIPSLLARLARDRPDFVFLTPA